MVEPSGTGQSRGKGGLASTSRRIERARSAVLVVIQLGLVLVLFLQANYLSCRRHTTLDLTRNRKFTLSDTAQNYLKNLGGEVRIVMAFLGTSELYLEVKALVSEFDRVGGMR